MSKTVAVVDDEPDIVELVSLHLRKASFNVKGFTDAEHFYRFLQQETPDLVVLDLMLPDADGFEVCKYVRNHERLSATPIIMLTARVEETDRVLGLELGADDYVTKPFSPRELVARVKAVLRRQEKKEPESKTIFLGGFVVIDPERYDVEVEGRKIDLTATEFRILELLATKRGWVFSREKILQHLWGDDKMVLDRTVDVHIKHLREKLGKAAELIKNVRGVGYKVEE
jgi:DNA-binding response OmpR family regulator